MQNEHWQGNTGNFVGSYIIQEIINLPKIRVADRLIDKITLALLHQKPEVVSFMLKRAAERQGKEKKLLECLEKKNNAGRMPLHIACQKCNTGDEGT